MNAKEHVKPGPDMWSSGFAIVAAPIKLPHLTRWLAVWDRGCGCTTHHHLRGHNTVAEIINQGGTLDDFDAYRIQPLDPT